MASRFCRPNAATECHLILAKAGDEVTALEDRWLASLHHHGIPADSTVYRRVFCADIAKHGPQLSSFARKYPGGFSHIGQPPLHGGSLAIWSQHIIDPAKPPRGHAAADGHSFVLPRGPLRHAWISGLCSSTESDSAAQTRAVLSNHDECLAHLGMTLARDVVRTWWYVRDIDAEYQGLVEARREAFTRHGLTPETHFIASTGIAGSPPAAQARLLLDSYAIHGLLPEQIEYPLAPDHLGPTHLYGVTFERATSVTHEDRKHIFLSGTASIDPAGRIVHPGDVRKQLDRTLENIRALLAAAQARLSDLSMALVYLRHAEDAPAIRQALLERFPGLPLVVLHAPVCRPGWLVEIEGIACVPAHHPEWPAY